MPAAWIYPGGRRRQGSCASVEGSLWSGVCTGLAVQRTPWGMSAGSCTRCGSSLGKLAAHITVTRGTGNLDADVELGLGQRVTLRHLVADLPRSGADPRSAPDLHGARIWISRWLR